jgi:hypothetical protein
MQIATNLSCKSNAAHCGDPSQTFPSLDRETRSHVDTACASFHLNRRPQTLRSWASTEQGAIRPVRICGRLAWAVADIKRALNGGANV